MGVEWQLRTAGRADLAAIAELIGIEDLHHRGRIEIDLATLEDLIAANLTFDADRDQVVAELHGEVIGAAIINSRGANITVHPDHEGAGLRQGLITWAEGRQRELCRVTFRIGAPRANEPAAAALTSAGYEIERFYASMIRDFALTGPPEPVSLPPGYRMRPIDPGHDVPALHRIDDRAFRERGDYLPETVEEYEQRHIASRGYVGEWSRVVATDAGEAAGSVIGGHRPEPGIGYIALLAVDPDHRRRGLARNLLLSAFGAIHAAGLGRAELHVASDNDTALDLYIGAGMVERDRFDHYVRTPR